MSVCVGACVRVLVCLKVDMFMCLFTNNINLPCTLEKLPNETKKKRTTERTIHIHTRTHLIERLYTSKLTQSVCQSVHVIVYGKNEEVFAWDGTVWQFEKKRMHRQLQCENMPNVPIHSMTPKKKNTKPRQRFYVIDIQMLMFTWFFLSFGFLFIEDLFISFTWMLVNYNAFSENFLGFLCFFLVHSHEMWRRFSFSCMSYSVELHWISHSSW